MKSKFRLDNLRKEMKDLALHGVLITSKNNCNYISGFTGSNGYILITLDEAYLFTDSRYIDQARSQMKDWNIKPIMKDFVCVREILFEIKKSIKNDVSFTMGFESKHISFDDFSRLKNAIDEIVSLQPLTDLLESIRAIKDSDEICNLSKSVALADNIMQKILNKVAPGVSELEISNLIDYYIVKSAAEGVSFPSIVATGLNSAFPHHMPTDQVIKKGDSLIIDMGVLYKGYRSDISRTVFVGEKEESKFSEIYSVVLGSQVKACQMATPGVKGGYLDHIAREFISTKGYGDYFIHGLGHGVGLDIHEKPMIVSSSQDVLDVGSVFTLEPGIYIPDWGGVRIEDIFIMEENGPKRLSRAPK